MASYTAITILLVGLLVGCTLGQRQNYVDENYEYEEAPLPPPRAAPRANSRPSFSSQSAAPRPTPVPILKQINRHNDDGSYTYGYEGADGSFKIETKLPTGEVMGKYGYVDDVGKVRVVEYGANRYGFQPAGEGITVAPPTLVDESTTKKGQQALYVDDGQYYEDEEPLPPRPRPAGKAAPRPHPRPAPVPAARFAPAPQPIYDTEIRSAPRPAARPASPPSRPSFTNAAPAPPRPSFTNAAPAPPRPVFANAPSASVPHRAPPQQAPRYQQPVFQPAPVYEDVPAPRPTHQQHHYPRPAQGGGGILDQLEKDYALPQSSGTYADVRFGSL